MNEEMGEAEKTEEEKKEKKEKKGVRENNVGPLRPPARSTSVPPSTETHLPDATLSAAFFPLATA